MARPVGSISKRTLAKQVLQARLFTGGVQPLEVILGNMRFYDEQAIELLTRIVAGADRQRPDEKLTSKVIDERMQLLKLFQQLCDEMRTKAEQCAVDAAPYCHAKLAHMTVRQEPVSLPNEMTREQALAEIQRRGYPLPLMIEQSLAINERKPE